MISYHFAKFQQWLTYENSNTILDSSTWQIPTIRLQDEGTGGGHQTPRLHLCSDVIRRARRGVVLRGHYQTSGGGENGHHHGLGLHWYVNTIDYIGKSLSIDSWNLYSALNKCQYIFAKFNANTNNIAKSLQNVILWHYITEMMVNVYV